MKTLMENWNKFVNEEKGILAEAEGERLAGITSYYQIRKLDPNFKFQKNPSSEHEMLKVLQDVDNPDTATVFDKAGEVIGTGLDLKSDPYWLRSVVTDSPGHIDYTMKNSR